MHYHGEYSGHSSGNDVCARAAVLASGGELVIEKHIYSGVTFAVAAKPFTPDWSV